MAYLPYGSVRVGDASTLPTDYTFTGQRNEAGIGLMHYGARFYSPRLGRFVSADTIVPHPGDPQAWNRYAYCLNNPLRYVDPTGQQVAAVLLTLTPVIILGVGLGLAYTYAVAPDAAQNREATGAAIEDAAVAIENAYERGRDSPWVSTVEAGVIIAGSALADALTEGGTGGDEAALGAGVRPLESSSIEEVLAPPLPFAKRQSWGDRGAGQWDRKGGQNDRSSKKPLPQPLTPKGPPPSNEPPEDLEFKPEGPPEPTSPMAKFLFAAFGLGIIYRGADALQLDRRIGMEFPGGGDD